jgi:hypothetical protein
MAGLRGALYGFCGAWKGSRMHGHNGPCRSDPHRRRNSCPFGLESIRPTKQPSNETEADVPNQEITQLIKQVVSPSTVEWERVISELQQARAYLDSEGERIERETQRYLQLSQTTVESGKIISDAVSEWRKAGHPV